jgi:hypothetical protein
MQVVIKQGEYKGMKAKVLFADDKTATVEIIARCGKKIEIARELLLHITDPTKPWVGKDATLDKMSFEDAQYRDIVDEDDLIAVGGNENKYDACGGSGTPKNYDNGKIMLI